MKTVKQHKEEIAAERRREREDYQKKCADIAQALEHEPVPEGARGTSTLQNRLGVKQAAAGQDDQLHWLDLACDECGHEMYTVLGRVLSSYPPKRNAYCPKCGNHDYITA